MGVAMLSRRCLVAILGGTELQWVGLECFFYGRDYGRGRVPRASRGAAGWDDVTVAGIWAVQLVVRVDDQEGTVVMVAPPPPDPPPQGEGGEFGVGSVSL